MKVRKENRVLTVDEADKAFYLSEGYDVVEVENGEYVVSEKATGGRTYTIAEYSKLEAENDALKAENTSLKAGIKKLKSEKAEKAEGKTGAVLLTLIERRLDNVIFRLGLEATRREARQLVSHSHFTVNGKKVNIPSYLVKVGDVIEVKEKSRSTARFKAIAEGETSSIVTPKWLEKNENLLGGKVVAAPQREDIDFPVEEHLIVELYSK